MSFWLLVGVYYIFFIFLLIRKKISAIDAISRSEIFVSLAGIGPYFLWRMKYTILPYINDSGSNPVWMWVYLCIELLSVCDLFQSYAFRLMPKRPFRQVGRSKSPGSVDLIIPTYNEPKELLRKTILCATQIEWGDLTINVLDDGDRADVKALCQELGVRYFSRSFNKGAKAGNMNAALKFLTGDYVAILDADFLAYKNFIKRAMIEFQDDDVAIVQFPQTFYNPDPTQHNSELFKELNDEQWVWYHQVLPIRDSANLATSCGSCSVVHRSALKLIGDEFPENTITEDFDLSLRMLDLGKVTRYVDEPVAIGLHAQSVNDFFKQRKRWALGNLAAFRLSLSRKGMLPLSKKIILFEWRAISLPARLITLFAPSTVFLLDSPPLKAESLVEYLAFTLPFIFFVSQNDILNAKVSVRNILLQQGRIAGLAISLGFEIIKAIVLPSKIKFQVTDKFENSKNTLGEGNLYRKIIMISLSLSCVSAFVGTYKIIYSPNNEVLDISLFWQVLNIYLIFLSLLMFSDKPHHRLSERFIPVRSEVARLIQFSDLQFISCEVVNISEGGALVVVDSEIYDDLVLFEINNVSVKSKVLDVKRVGDRFNVRLRFEATSASQDDLVREIYTGNYSPEIITN